jgi:hypothetical protein
LRKSLLVYASLVLFPVVLAQTAPLAFLVFDARVARPGRLPDGWRIHVNHGSPDVTVTDDAQGRVLHLKSRASSFGLEREVNVDPAQLPFLTWRWKVADLPRGGDFRHARTDDQAAQVLVAFDDHRILTYIWDSTAPRGTMQSASAIPLVHIFALVCRSGPAEANQWLSEVRNVGEDYQRAYGRPAPRVQGVRLQINSQHTSSSAESYFGEVAFRSALQ